MTFLITQLLACAVCEPGITQTCLCAGAEEGAQSCASDGASWSECDCGDSDADTDSDSDSDTDTDADSDTDSDTDSDADTDVGEIVGFSGTIEIDQIYSTVQGDCETSIAFEESTVDGVLDLDEPPLLCDVNETGFEVKITRFHINLHNNEPSSAWAYVRVYDDVGGFSDHRGAAYADTVTFEGSQADLFFNDMVIGDYKYDMDVSLQAERE